MLEHTGNKYPGNAPSLSNKLQWDVATDVKANVVHCCWLGPRQQEPHGAKTVIN